MKPPPIRQRLVNAATTAAGWTLCTAFWIALFLTWTAGPT